MSKRNKEHYWDPTPADAESNIRKQDKAVEQKKRALNAIRVILAMKTMAKNHDFEVIGHLSLRDRNSGQEYKEGGII